MNNPITLLLIAVLAIYMIIRQLTEQQVNPLTLLVLPALSAYASYTELQPAFVHFAVLPLIGGLIIGAVAGLATGIFRGRHTTVRLDSASGLIYSRPLLASSLTWLILLITRIGVIALDHSPLAHSLLAEILIASGGTIFLASIATQKFMVFMQYNRLRSDLARPTYRAQQTSR